MSNTSFIFKKQEEQVYGFYSINLVYNQIKIDQK